MRKQADTIKLINAISEYRIAQYPIRIIRDGKKEKREIRILPMKLSRETVFAISKRVLGRVHEALSDFKTGDELAAIVINGRAILEVYKSHAILL